MRLYGSDKPDTRFGMTFVELMDVLKGTGEFSVFNDAAYIGGICATGCASYTRKQIDQLTDFVKRSQIGAKGLVYARVQEDGSVKSSVDKFYSQDVLQQLLMPSVKTVKLTDRDRSRLFYLKFSGSGKILHLTLLPERSYVVSIVSSPADRHRDR